MADDKKEDDINLETLPKAGAAKTRRIYEETIAGCNESIGELSVVAALDLAVDDKDSLKQRKDAIMRLIKRRNEAQKRLDALKPTSTAPAAGQS